MKKLIFLVLLFPAIAFAQIQPADQWNSTTTPQSAITQRIYGKPIKISGLRPGECLMVASNGLATTTGAACGSGSGSVTSVNVSGGTSGFTFSGGPITTSGTITLSGTLGIANGGTNATSYNPHMLISFDGTRFVATSSPVVGYLTATSTISTSTLPLLGTNDLTSLTSAGFDIFSNSSTKVATFGAGGGSNVSFFGGMNIDGQTRLATSLTGSLNGNAGVVYSTATSTPTVTAPITYSGTLGQFLSGISGAFGCLTASGSVTGCLSSTDWTTFNNKQATISTTWPITLSGATVGFNGLSTSTAAVQGNIPYFSGVNTFANVATTTLSGSGLISVTAGGSVIGSSPITVSCPTCGTGTVTSVTGTYPVQSSGGATPAISLAFGTTTSNTWAGTQTFTNAPTVTAFNTAGTVNNTSSGVLYSTATTSFTPSSAFTITGTIGALMGGSNSTIDLATNGTALSKLAQVAANTVLGNNTGSTGNVVAYATSTLGIALSDTTGTLAIARGGTNATSFTTSGNAVYYDGTKLATAPTTGAVTTPYASSTAITASGLGTFGTLGVGSTSPGTTLGVAGSIYATGGVGVGKVNTTANTVDTASGGIYKINGTNILQASTTLKNLYYGISSGGNTSMTGIENLIFGSPTANGLQSNTTGSYNTAIGNHFNVFNNNTTGSYNVAIGDNALAANTTGSSNVALGGNAMIANQTGSNNVGFANALGSATSSSNNFGLGYGALNSMLGGDNIGIGDFAMGGGANAYGYGNFAAGGRTLFHLTTGIDNIAIGTDDGINSYPTAGSLTTGSYNIVLGRFAFTGAITSSYNIIQGVQAGNALTSGDSNIMIGQNAGRGAADTTSGSYNTFLGYVSGSSVSTLSYGTAIGYQATVGCEFCMVLGGTGNSGVTVGIGTTTPYAELTVQGQKTATTTLALVPKGSQTANILDIYSNAVTPVLNSVITAAGNWGISTTSPSQTLSVSGNEYITGTLGIGLSSTANANAKLQIEKTTVGGGTTMSIGNPSNNNNAWSEIGLYNDLGYASRAQILFGSSAYAPADGSTANAFELWNNVSGGNIALMTTGAGNVGIATTTPASKFSVSGSGYITGGLGVGARNNTTGTISATVAHDTIDSTGLYKINGSTMLSASTTRTNYFFGSNPGTLQTTMSGTNNIGVGVNDLNANTTGAGNVAFGRDALFANTTGNTNVAIGYQAFRNATTSGTDNVAIGDLALAGSASVANTGSNNVAIGASALTANTSGSSNIAIGPSALGAVTTGQFNIGIGNQAYASSATGQNNTVLGISSMKYAKTGNYNVAVGTSANQYNMSATSTTVIGEEAAQGVNGTSFFQNVTSIGYRSLFAITTADDTTAIGYQSGSSVTSGVQNTFLGSLSGGGVTTGSGNTLIGYNTTVTSGTISNSLAFGVGASVGCSNCMVFGGGGGSNTIVGFGTSTPYAKLTVQNTTAATTTMALVPAASQSANILDIYNTASPAVLTSVINSSGKLGMGTTTPVAIIDSYTTASSTNILLEAASGKGGCLIMKDVAGSGYTQITAQAGVLSAKVTTSLTTCN